MENKYLIFDEVNDIYDIDRQALFTFLLSQGFDDDLAEQWLEDDDAFTELVINSFAGDLEEATEEEIEDWATTEMEFYSEENDFDLNENKMTNEQLRMQMLAGIITESQYKSMLNENKDIDGLRSHMENAIDRINNNENLSDKGKKQRIDNVRFVVYNSLDPNTNGGERPSSDFQFDDAWWNSTYEGADDFVTALVRGEIEGAVKGNSFGEDPMNESKSLNESMIGGIVGIGAINQIPATPKTDYEMAFEHFLGEKYEIKPNRERDDIKDVNEDDSYNDMDQQISDEGDLNESNIDQMTGGIKGAFNAIRSLPLPDNAKLKMAKTGVGIATLNAIGQKISASQNVSPEGKARLEKAMAAIKQATSIDEVEQALLDAVINYASTNK
jgi:hypothetical protein